MSEADCPCGVCENLRAIAALAKREGRNIVCTIIFDAYGGNIFNPDAPVKEV